MFERSKLNPRDTARSQYPKQNHEGAKVRDQKNPRSSRSLTASAFVYLRAFASSWLILGCFRRREVQSVGRNLAGGIVADHAIRAFFLLFVLCAATPQTVQVPADHATAILGAPVAGPDGKDLGRIIDVLVDGTGQPRAAVIDFGGFLGMGARHIAVSWTNLHFTPTAPDKMTITLDLSADQIKAAPAYTDTKPAAVVVARPAPK
jgi:hypothetical protein